MNRKILILALATLATAAYAQSERTAAEEAIILNQELQFLEDSVNNVQAVSVNTTTEAAQSRDRAINTDSLERTYFGETEEDVVNTRTSAPQKRTRGL